MMKITVHEFNMGDVEDLEIYVAAPIYDWQQTEAGKWVMAHSKPEPEWVTSFDVHQYGYRVAIRATLSEEDVTFFKLKWGNR